MKIKFLLVASLGLLMLTGSVTAQKSFDTFWQKFKSAVIKGDKATVVSLTRFPFSLGYDPSAANEEGFIKTRASFLRRYNYVFNEEVDAVKCFENTAPEKDPGGYVVACSFKGEPPDSEKPFDYTFKRTKQGWRFVEFTNINE